MSHDPSHIFNAHALCKLTLCKSYNVRRLRISSIARVQHVRGEEIIPSRKSYDIMFIWLPSYILC